MKKAIDYFKYMSSEDGIINLYNDSKIDFINAIKQAQIDAVKYAVKICAEEAKIDDEYIDLGDTYDNNLITSTDEQGETHLYTINEQSILDVATKIKKEIDDTY